MPSLMTRLRAASEGLLYMSESDHPFTPVYWPRELLPCEEITADSVKKLAGVDRAKRAATQDVDDFFRPLVVEEDWYEDEDREFARRYQRLKETLEDQLTDLRVFKFGAIEKDVFVVGRTPEGGIGGLRTRAIET